MSPKQIVPPDGRAGSGQVRDRDRGLVARLDAFQRRHTWLGFPIAVTYKFYEDQANFLAAIITYYGFISLFFLLLLLVTILGFVSSDVPGIRHVLEHSALTRFPIVGGELRRNVHSISGGVAELVVELVVCVHGGLEVVQAAWWAFARIAATPRQDRLNPLQTRLRSLVLLLVLGVGILITTGLSAATTNLEHLIGTAGQALGTLLSFGLNLMIFVFAFRWLSSTRPPIREVAFGAVVAAACWQTLQSLGTFFITRELHGVNAFGGLFGVVLALLAWIYVEAVVLVVSAEINVVAARRLWPRSLLSLWTDTTDLTDADRAAYEAYTHIERYKSFQQIVVNFRPGVDVRTQPRRDDD